MQVRFGAEHQGVLMNDHHKEAVPSNWIGIAEAAVQLGYSTKTVMRRIDAGVLRARKYRTKHGPKWYIDPASWDEKVPTDASSNLRSSHDNSAPGVSMSWGVGRWSLELGAEALARVDIGPIVRYVDRQWAGHGQTNGSEPKEI
jgi:hypothetical protein